MADIFELGKEFLCLGFIYMLMVGFTNLAIYDVNERKVMTKYTCMDCENTKRKFQILKNIPTNSKALSDILT